MEMEEMINSMEELSDNINEELETATDENEIVNELANVPSLDVPEAEKLGVAAVVPFCCTVNVPDPLNFSVAGGARIAYSLECLKYVFTATTQAIPSPCGCPGTITVYETRIVGSIPYWISGGTVSGTCPPLVPGARRPEACCHGSVCVDVLVKRTATPPTPEKCPIIDCNLVRVSPISILPLPICPGDRLVRFAGFFTINCP